MSDQLSSLRRTRVEKPLTALSCNEAPAPLSDRCCHICLAIALSKARLFCGKNLQPHNAFKRLPAPPPDYPQRRLSRNKGKALVHKNWKRARDCLTCAGKIQRQQLCNSPHPSKYPARQTIVISKCSQRATTSATMSCNVKGVLTLRTTYSTIIKGDYLEASLHQCHCQCCEKSVARPTIAI